MKQYLYITLFCGLTVMTAKAQQVPAGEILKQAYAQASRENKNVFLIFHASWCGWCHKMDSSINDPSCKSFFEKNYVIRHLDVLEMPGQKNLENPGALDLLKKYHAEDQGIPFWVIFDKYGNLLADSKLRPDGAGLNATGENIGCPATQEEVNHFIKLLRKTSSLNDGQLAVIAKRFLLNGN